MNELIEDYQRKINSVSELLKDKTNSEETINRLKIKVGCYRSFLVDLNRALNIDLVMLTPDAIAKHIGWDGYHHMMINEYHIDHQLKEAINMLFFTNKLEVPFG